MTGNKNDIQSTYRIPKELHRQARVLALQQGRSLSEVLEELIREWVQKQEAKPKEG